MATRKDWEHVEQVAIFRWARLHERKYPELRLLYAVPNGGHRHPATAAKLKAEGVRAGVPDISLDVARGGYHGLRIEMKAGRNKPTEAQEAFMALLREQGYCCRTAYGYDEARIFILNYLAS